jgi:hypothetical protein
MKMNSASEHKASDRRFWGTKNGGIQSCSEKNLIFNFDIHKYSI